MPLRSRIWLLRKVESRRFADFYTSVDVHPIFGRLLARQLAEMWDLLGRPAEFVVVESGAGTGRLAAHILDFAARELRSFYDALRYVAVEQSAARRAAHQESIGAHLARGRAFSAAELPPEVPVGCILSNELLDALPVHRVVMLPKGLREVYVAEDTGTLTEKLGPLSTPEIAGYFEEQGITLQENQQAEAGLEVCRWIEDAGRRLGRGFVLTIDYGREAAELYNERHMCGTLLAYSEHRATRGLSAASRRAGLDRARQFYRAGSLGTPRGAGQDGMRLADGVSGGHGPGQ